MRVLAGVAAHSSSSRRHQEGATTTLSHQRNDLFCHPKQAKGCHPPTQLKMLVAELLQGSVTNLRPQIEQHYLNGADFFFDMSDAILH